MANGTADPMYSGTSRTGATWCCTGAKQALDAAQWETFALWAQKPFEILSQPLPMSGPRPSKLDTKFMSGRKED